MEQWFNRMDFKIVTKQKRHRIHIPCAFQKLKEKSVRQFTLYNVKVSFWKVPRPVPEPSGEDHRQVDH